VRGVEGKGRKKGELRVTWKIQWCCRVLHGRVNPGMGEERAGLRDDVM